MRKETSILLEAFRFLAALFVFFAHLRNQVLPSLPAAIGWHGREAVAIFFVLSGFVIRFVTQEKEKDGRSYSVARISRISSAVIPAVFLTVILDLVGRSLTPTVYAGFAPIDQGSLLTVLTALTFTNEAWFSHIILGSNEPYWSMGFEIWYYVIFGIAVYCRGPLRTVLLGVVFIIVGPKILLYIPLWLLGVVLYDLVAGLKPFSRQRAVGWALVVASTFAYLIVHRLVAPNVESIFHFNKVDLALSSFCYFFFVAILTAGVILGFDLALRETDIWSKRVAKGIRWLAGCSFTLYLIHQPLLLFWSAVIPSFRGSAGGAFVISSLTLGSVLVAAELGERRKRQYRSLVEALVPRRRLDPTTARHVP